MLPTFKNLTSFLKIDFQLGRIYLDMLNVYKVMSDNITQAIGLNGEGVTKQPIIKGMRVIKKETLKLIAGWVSRSNNSQMVLENFIPPLLDAVLLDYQMTSVPTAREPEVLSTMAAIVNKLEVTITPHVPKIFDAVFECTLNMINKDFEEFPEHRTNFFLLLQVSIGYLFSLEFASVLINFPILKSTGCEHALLPGLFGDSSTSVQVGSRLDNLGV